MFEQSICIGVFYSLTRSMLFKISIPFLLKLILSLDHKEKPLEFETYQRLIEILRSLEKQEARDNKLKLERPLVSAEKLILSRMER